MVRMGPRMGPTMGPQIGPNAVGDEDPLVGYSETFITDFNDGFLFLAGDLIIGAAGVNGEGPFRLTTTGALPNGLLTDTDYWAIPTVLGVGNDTIKLAASLADALADIKVEFLDDGTGVHTMTYVG